MFTNLSRAIVFKGVQFRQTNGLIATFFTILLKAKLSIFSNS